MIDFKELPEDGNAFEQLIREMLLFYDLHPQWSGKGPDQGRDIIATEILRGPLGDFERKWLVQCKHFAHSRKSVGRTDVGDVVGDCRQVGAQAYLLACSTQPSSSLITKLKEITARLENQLLTKFWDGVDIEKRMNEPRLFALGHIFFPKSFSSTPWRLYNRGAPNLWSAHYKDYFLHLNSRIAGSHPGLKDCECIIAILEKISPTGEDEVIRPRAIHFDDKHGNFTVFADYLVPHNQEPSLKPSDFNAILRDGIAVHNLYGDSNGYPMIYWDIQVQRISPNSDHFHKDHYDYYNYKDGNYRIGLHRGDTLGDIVEYGNSWA